MPIKLLRLKEVSERRGLARAAIYQLVRDGLWPEPIKTGPTTTFWIESEVERTLEAIISGASKAEQRALVAEMHAARPDGRGTTPEDSAKFRALRRKSARNPVRDDAEV